MSSRQLLQAQRGWGWCFCPKHKNGPEWISRNSLKRHRRTWRAAQLSAPDDDTIVIDTDAGSDGDDEAPRRGHGSEFEDGDTDPDEGHEGKDDRLIVRECEDTEMEDEPGEQYSGTWLNTEMMHDLHASVESPHVAAAPYHPSSVADTEELALVQEYKPTLPMQRTVRFLSDPEFVSAPVLPSHESDRPETQASEMPSSPPAYEYYQEPDSSRLFDATEVSTSEEDKDSISDAPSPTPLDEATVRILNLPEWDGSEDTDADDAAMEQLEVIQYFTSFRMEDLPIMSNLETTERLQLAAQLIQWKDNLAVSERSFDGLRLILRRFKVKIPSFKGIVKQLEIQTGIKGRKIHCCLKSHMCFVGRWARARRCPVCSQKRFEDDRDSDDEDQYTVPHPEDSDEDDLQVDHGRRSHNRERKPHNWFIYFPVIPTLLLWWANTETAAMMKAHRQYHEEKLDPLHPKHGVFEDFWDGRLFKEYHPVRRGTFQDTREIALGYGIDGFRVVDEANVHCCFPFLLKFLNIPQKFRMKKDFQMVPMLVPGPREPGDLTTWMRPLKRELRQLERGVPAFDGDAQEPFMMHAYMVCTMGDQKAINTLLQMKGANSQFGCRICWNEGERLGNVYYYPYREEKPLVFRARIRETIQDVCDTVRGKARRQKQTGIRGYTPLMDVPSIQIPRAIPYGPMHLVEIGVFKDGLSKLWKGEEPFDSGKRPRSRSQSRERGRDGRFTSANSLDGTATGFDAEALSARLGDLNGLPRRRQNSWGSGTETVSQSQAYEDYDGSAREQGRPMHTASDMDSRPGTADTGSGVGSQTRHLGTTDHQRQVYQPGDYVLAHDVWQEIGEELVNATRTVPATVGRALKNIATHVCGYRASSWSTFILLYAIPVFTGRLPDKYVANLKIFLRAYELMLRTEHTEATIAEMRGLWLEFVLGFQTLYMDYTPDVHEEEAMLPYYVHPRPDPARLKVMSTNVHALLHIADHILDLGNVRVYWEYSVERLGDMLQKMVRSKQRISEGLVNAVSISELIKVAAHAQPALGMRDRKKTKRPAGAYMTDTGMLLRKRYWIDLRHPDWDDLRTALDEHVHHITLATNLRVAHKAQIFERWMMGTTIIGSRRSQRAGHINRDSQYIRYGTQTSTTGTWAYAEVLHFVAVTVHGLERWGAVAPPPSESDTSVATDIDSSVESDPPSDAELDTLEEHYFAVLQPWETSIGDAGLLFESERTGLKIIDIRMIQGLVGRFSCTSGDYIVSRSEHAIIETVLDQL